MDQDIQDRIDKLARPENFTIRIDMRWQLRAHLNDSEDKRMETKLKLVQQIAAKLATNMVKGTLKYDTDDWSVDQWLEYAIDDSCDTTNYLHLMKEARKKELEGIAPLTQPKWGEPYVTDYSENNE